ncbi:hypothetical protein SAMN04244573_02481 [Azotobacter beijerinckii]|uniref:Uncharacterized protein n=2 Tax=Azotobacter beijerinckii TaxID=170623 RepID=A0A1H9JTI7_9GAMM|nr:hypothetical protein [Azotobacter beijerinckii]SEQ90130.1 hypothetical protein SAMN04244573_02481 [Azotobacter beijerinckii]
MIAITEPIRVEPWSFAPERSNSPALNLPNRRAEIAREKQLIALIRVNSLTRRRSANDLASLAREAGIEAKPLEIELIAARAGIAIGGRRG